MSSAAYSKCMYLWTGGTLLSKFELSGGKEGLAGSSEPAVDIDKENSMTTRNDVV